MSAVTTNARRRGADVRRERDKFFTEPQCGGREISARTRDGLDEAIKIHVSRCERCVAFAQGLTVPPQLQLDLEVANGRS